MNRERGRHFVRFLRETTIGPTSVRARWRTGKLLFLLCRSSFCASRLHAYIEYTVFSSREETPRYDRINITGANSRSEQPRIVRSFVTSRRVEIPRPARFSRSRGCRWKFVCELHRLPSFSSDPLFEHVAFALRSSLLGWKNSRLDVTMPLELASQQRSTGVPLYLDGSCVATVSTWLYLTIPKTGTVTPCHAADSIDHVAPWFQSRDNVSPSLSDTRSSRGRIKPSFLRLCRLSFSLRIRRRWRFRPRLG